MEYVSPVADEVVLLDPEPLGFASFYARDYRRVVALAYALSGSRAAAEEIAQDAFAVAHRRWRDVAAFDDPGAWVRRVAANRARSHWRRRAAEARALLRLQGRRSLPVELPVSSADFWSAVRSLPRTQAIVAALHYFDDRSVADIAAVLDISEGTVKTHLSRARRTLAMKLRAEVEEESE